MRSCSEVMSTVVLIGVSWRLSYTIIKLIKRSSSRYFSYWSNRGDLRKSIIRCLLFESVSNRFTCFTWMSLKTSWTKHARFISASIKFKSLRCQMWWVSNPLIVSCKYRSWLTRLRCNMNSSMRLRRLSSSTPMWRAVRKPSSNMSSARTKLARIKTIRLGSRAFGIALLEVVLKKEKQMEGKEADRSHLEWTRTISP